MTAGVHVKLRCEADTEQGEYLRAARTEIHAEGAVAVRGAPQGNTYRFRGRVCQLAIRCLAWLSVRLPAIATAV